MNSTAIKTLLTDQEDELREFFGTFRRPDISRAARDLAVAHRAAVAALEPAVLLANFFKVGQSPEALLGALHQAASKIHAAAKLSHADISALNRLRKYLPAKSPEVTVQALLIANPQL